jgi:predicted AlkP superfamily pyrophosphatase or phosphodiesterase
MLRVDRYLGAFIDSVFQLRDSTRVLLTLTGDHGMSPYPQILSPVTPNPGAIYVDVSAPFQRALQQLAVRGVDTTQVAFDDGAFTIGDTSSFVKARISVDSVARGLAAAIRRVEGVHRVDFLTDLVTADTTTDVIARRWQRMYAPGGPVRFVTTLNRFNYWKGTPNATHGSPWDQDAWVPVMFWGTPFRAGKYDTRAAVVDMAPTLAAVLGVRPTEALDGIVLRQALKR